MDLELDVTEEEKEYLATIGAEAVLTLALEKVAKTRPIDPVLGLVEEIQRVMPNDTLVEGYPVACSNNVELGVGPVVGEVTHNMAIVAIEVKDAKGKAVDITCDLYRLYRF